MAIRAQKIALARLGTHGFKRARQPTLAQPKSLCFGVAVVELERSNALVVAAENTAPACFLNEDLLDTPAPRGNRNDAASAASVGPIAIEHELRQSVCLAIPIEFDLTVLPAGA